MGELKKIEKITDSDIKRVGVQALADRPNRSSQYGTGGLSASELKKSFDSLASLISKRLNELIEGLSSDDAANYIKVALGDYTTLGDIILAIENGELARKLKVYPSASATNAVALQVTINGITKNIADEIENRISADTDLQKSVKANTEIVDKLNGDEYSDGSVKQQIAAAISKADTKLQAGISAETTARESAVEDLQADIADEAIARSVEDAKLQEAINTLNGDAHTKGSVQQQIAEAIAAIVYNSDETMNSIQELVDWVNDHASGALELSNKVIANETAIAGKMDKIPFTSIDTGKFVTVGDNGELVAKDITVGGSY